ncbi:MAG: mitofilin family membrane protein [Pseudomonadota bacterium]
MTDDTSKKPKAAKKPLTPAKAEQTKIVGHEADAQKPPIAWSVVVLSLLIGAGVAMTLFYAVLRAGVMTPLDEAGTTQVRALADRVAKIETERSRINTLENSVNRLEATRNSVSALEEKQESDVHRIESALRDIKPDPKLTIAPLQARLDTVERKLQSVSQVEIAENERLLALAMSGLALKEALDKGAAFSGEYAVVKNLLPNGSNLDGLEAYANTGVPTTAALLARFETVSQSMLKAQLPPDAGFLDKSVAFFQNLVSVRKVGDIEGNDAEAILARVELRLQQNNSESAHQEYQKLEPRLQQIAQPWGKDLVARAAADKVMRDLLLASAKNLQPKKTVPQE